MKVLVLGSQKICIDIIDFINGEKSSELVGVLSSDSEHDTIYNKQSVQEFCRDMKIPYYGENISEEILENLSPDIVFSVYYRKIIKSKLLGKVPMGWINLHPSMLPRNRGPNPVYWTIKRGERISGQTLHYIDRGMDTGDIISQKAVEVMPHYTGKDLNNILMDIGLELFKENYENIISNKGARFPQLDFGNATCNSLYCDDMRIVDWNKPVLDIYNHIRAHTKPYSGSICFYKGREIILWKSYCIEFARSSEGPGSFIVNGNNLIVQTHTTPIAIEEFSLGNDVCLPTKGRFDIR